MKVPAMPLDAHGLILNAAKLELPELVHIVVCMHDRTANYISKYTLTSSFRFPMICKYEQFIESVLLVFVGFSKCSHHRDCGM